MNRGGGGTLSRQCRCRDARGVKEKALRFFKEGGGGGGEQLHPTLCQTIRRLSPFSFSSSSSFRHIEIDRRRWRKIEFFEKKKTSFPNQEFPFSSDFSTDR